MKAYGIVFAGLVLMCGFSFAAGAPPAADDAGGWIELIGKQGLAAWRRAPAGRQRSLPDRWLHVGDTYTADQNATRLLTRPGTGVLVNGTGGRSWNLVTKAEFADVEAHIEFMVPKGSNSGVYFMGRYEVQILDSWGKEKVKYSDCGGIYQRWDPSRGKGNEGFEGHAPRQNASRPPGQWQTFDVVFRAPRFDAQGKKMADAEFVRVVHNGVVVHEHVKCSGPTRAACFNDEQPTGPLMLQGDHGPVAYRNIRIRPLGGAAASRAVQQRARDLLTKAGFRGGLIVHLGCGSGHLTAELGAGQGRLVQGLDADAANVERARQHVASRGLEGRVTIRQLRGSRLPYVDHLVNLLVAEQLGNVPMAEVMRVLCPGGVAYIKRGADWQRMVKPPLEGTDEWTHYLHDASNNAVSHDKLVGPPEHLQWVGSPRYGRHHDHMSSLSAMVSAGGRVFYIFDEGSPASILLPPQWKLIARDAYNGTVLWKRPIKHWFTHLWRLKSGPAQLPRRLVTDGRRVYVTLGIDAPLSALDAATGKTLRTYEGTRATEEVILAGDVLIALVNERPEESDEDGWQRFRQSYRAEFWEGKPRKIVALSAADGRQLWSVTGPVLPGTLAADQQRVVWHDGERIVCLDRATGRQLWQSQPIARSEKIYGFYIPILVLYQDVVLFSGGETAGLQKGEWYTSGKDTMTALSAETGKVLWTAYHPPSGYRSPEDLLVLDGLVWTGETTSGRAVGLFTGRDVHTGRVERQFTPDVQTYWFHHRCYRGRATDRYLLMSRAGIEFVDVQQQHWITNHWVRGACLYGIMPANGLVYAPQHPCACYLESKLFGLNALAAAPLRAAGNKTSGGDGTAEPRLQRGPAYDQVTVQAAAASSPVEDWPTYRHDAARSGRASTRVPASVTAAWDAAIGGKLTSPVVAGGKVFVAAVDRHTLYALDAQTGQSCWQFTAGGRIDSPPTVWQGRVLFGSADGYVYCLRATDGLLVWRFRAAVDDQQLMAFEQLESVWPVPGNVLVLDGVVYFVAGRSMFLDSGMRLWRLDGRTGEVLSETVLDEQDRATGKDLQSYVSWLNMPPALPDILSSDGKWVYMRSQPFHLDGTRPPLKPMPRAPDADRGAPPPVQQQELAHLFSPTGFTDDTAWHRTYWMYGSTYVSGWSGYFLAGRAAPAGRILALGEEQVYGFGRKPNYYRWSTTYDYHLFAADKKLPKLQATADGRAPAYAVRHTWTVDLPLLVRAMVLAGDRLFVAGPPQLIKEGDALKQIRAPEVQAKLQDQLAAWQGKKGGLLWVVSARDGSKLAQLALASPPVFDGLVAAQGRLYMTTLDGKLVCFGRQ